jgi:hypothetical protein
MYEILFETLDGSYTETEEYLLHSGTEQAETTRQHSQLSKSIPFYPAEAVKAVYGLTGISNHLPLSHSTTRFWLAEKTREGCRRA